MLTTPTTFILDVDGVLTDGRFYYTSAGKVMKVFGDGDNDALVLIKKYLHIHLVSGDKRGFDITAKRVVEDMNLPLDQVSTFNRIEWIRSHYQPDRTIYMGDGIFDPLVFKHVAYGIAPANAFFRTREAADFVTASPGGERAVAEACWHIAEKFFEPINLETLSFAAGVGVWK